MEKIFYHGSLINDIEKFNPFSHFGSKLAATEAAFRRLHLGEKGSPTLYKTTINIPADKTIEMPDWASPRPRDLAEALALHFSDDRAEQFQSIVSNISIREAGDLSLRLSLFERIKVKLLPNIKGIYYKNEHEGIYGEKTLCLVCNDCVTSTVIEAFDRQEVERVKALLHQKHPRT
ncbi:hypothetical protein [Pseudoalteromonas gelatinilytica]